MVHTRYGRQANHKKAVEAFKRLTVKEQDKAISAITSQKSDYDKKKATGEFVPEFPDAFRWLRDRRFDDEVIEKKVVGGPFKSSIDG